MQNPVGNELLRPLDAGNRPRIEKILAAPSGKNTTKLKPKQATSCARARQKHRFGGRKTQPSQLFNPKQSPNHTQ